MGSKRRRRRWLAGVGTGVRETGEAEIGRCVRAACIYSPNAYRGFAREFIKDLERIRPQAILDIIRSGENFRISTTTRMPEQGICTRCGYISSQGLDSSWVGFESLKIAVQGLLQQGEVELGNYPGAQRKQAAEDRFVFVQREAKAEEPSTGVGDIGFHEGREASICVAEAGMSRGADGLEKSSADGL
ncbi:Cytoplasmic tRNA 2-thiolation protein 1 [Platanthera guangdongensis]|uniref:Cytoplasmic tRNA 2-thiolation protein 1 n=1 Tax=Platanthera guangdongensis TaxID=2320717 RepID=A0ABR2LBT9_9ASPA